MDIIFGSMAANVKGQNYDLLSKLMNQGVVTQAQYDKAMEIFKNNSGSDLADKEKAVNANFTMRNSTGKNIKELYITDSSLSSYDKEFLSNNNYNSWSNGKTIKTINALGLSSDKRFTDSMNAVTTSINAMGKEIGKNTGNFTTAEISEYNNALDSLDSLVNKSSHKLYPAIRCRTLTCAWWKYRAYAAGNQFKFIHSKKDE